MVPKTCKKIVLLILDGWGIAPHARHSAIAQARTPCTQKLFRQYPSSQLRASGCAVGLPEGQMGNSEVGHMNLGAGRVVDQPLMRIGKAIESGILRSNPSLITMLNYAKMHNKAVHLLGLVSDGGVHAHIDHLKALCQIAREREVSQLFVHAFTDGRDTAPQSTIPFLLDLEAWLRHTTGQLASVIGRYYAMDRNLHWDRTKVAYDALVYGRGTQTTAWYKAIEQSYARGITDEFLRPIVLTDQAGVPVARVRPGDVAICFNFRTDRSRQITQALTQTALPQWSMYPLDIHYLTMTVYDTQFQGVRTLFEREALTNTLGEVLSRHGKRQLRIAETEKYPHVTYFFSGNVEVSFPGEERILCPSPSVATYDQAPAMAAPDITDRLLSVLTRQRMDFICLNFANADMVGHTGVFDATVRACEVVDQCVAKVIKGALANDYATLIVADHGNAEQMRDEQHRPYTAHTTNPVPCILVDPQTAGPLQAGKLADVAPTILWYMGIPIPTEMTGSSLLPGPATLRRVVPQHLG